MFLAIDIGNSTVHLALFRGRRIVRRTTLATRQVATGQALAAQLEGALEPGCTPEGSALASVVPECTGVISRECMRLLGIAPMRVGPKEVGIPLGSYPARQVGIDRLLVARAAWERYEHALIVVDIGTAVTFDAVSSDGVFLGGAILPGVELQAGALADSTAQLPLISAKRPRRVIGTNTRACIASGIHFGLIGAIDGVLARILDEMGGKPVIIATGGGARAIAPHLPRIQHVHPDLVVEGLRLAWNDSQK